MLEKSAQKIWRPTQLPAAFKAGGIDGEVAGEGAGRARALRHHWPQQANAERITRVPTR